MSFAPGVGASETISMLARVPVLLQAAVARMSSMARSRIRIDESRAIVHWEPIRPPREMPTEDDVLGGQHSAKGCICGCVVVIEPQLRETARSIRR